MNIQFGSGVLYGVPAAGDLAANPTPYKFGVLQDAQVNFKGNLKKLYGQKQFAVATARGKIDVTVKAKLAVLDPSMLNQLYFGQNSAAGITLVSDDEAQTVPAAAPYTITVSNAGTSGVNFQTDYGVRYGSSGQQLVRVAATPVQGQYSVSAGVYSFAAADEGAAVLISYTYSVASRGETLTLDNQLLGFAPEFKALLYNSYHGKFFGIELNNCTMGQLSIPTKQEDFWIMDIDFEANTDAGDSLGKLYGD